MRKARDTVSVAYSHEYQLHIYSHQLCVRIELCVLLGRKGGGRWGGGGGGGPKVLCFILTLLCLLSSLTFLERK